jgi:flavin reductase (DIM6/NTAB) family NADH-FMN oxidoreductase RutF
MENGFDPVELRRAFACYPSGVTVIAGSRAGKPAGLAISSFTPVSLTPALVSVCIAHTSQTWPVIRDLPCLGISVLAQDQEFIASAMSAKCKNRFAGVSWSASPSGAVFIDGAALELECILEFESIAGDHQIVVLRIVDLRSDAMIAPMVFHTSSYRRLAPLSA